MICLNHTPMQGGGWRHSFYYIQSSGGRGRQEKLPCLMQKETSLIQAHFISYRLIQAHSRSFELIWLIRAHLNSCVVGKNHIYIDRHSEDAYFYAKRNLRLINIKALFGELGFHPPTRGSPFFLDCCSEQQLNSSSHTLSEAIGKWVLLM